MAHGAEYFDVFFPESSVNVGQRFFFFNSLFNKPDPEANHLGKYAQSIVKSGLKGLKTNKNEQGLTIIQQSMQFLQNMANVQAEAEQKYFLQKIQQKGVTEQLSKELKQCFPEGGPINYLTFMKIINEYYQNGTEFKNILSQEQARLTSLKKAYAEYQAWKDKTYSKTAQQRRLNEIKKSKNKQPTDPKFDPEEMAKQYILSNEDIIWEDFNNYLKEHNSQLKGSKTLANVIAPRMKTIYNDLMRNGALTAELQNLIGVDTPLDSVKEQVIAYIVGQFSGLNLSSIEKELNERMSKQDWSSATSRKFTRELGEQIIDAILGNSSDKATMQIDDTELTRIKNNVKLIAQDSRAKKQVSDRLLKILGFNVIGYNAIGNKRGNLQNLSNVLLDILLEELASIEVNEVKKVNKDGTVVMRSKRSIVIDKVAKYIEQVLGKDPKINGKLNYELIASTINSLVNKYTKIEFKPSAGMPGKTITAAQMIKDSAGTIINQIPFGDTTSKNDIIFLDLGDYIVKFPDKIINDITDIIADNFLNSLSSSDKTIRYIDPKTGLSKDFNEKIEREKYGYDNKEFFLRGETERRLALMQQSFNEVSKTISDLETVNDKQTEALNIMRSMFSVGASVKSYDKYNNTRGFHGGSIGGSVETQIGNILTMFEYGGISPPDYDWLVFSVYNSGDALVGNEARTKLEDLFSTVAVMMLFDDAGVQAQYVTNQAEKYSHGITDSIHIYNLNGIYVPESLVLKLTYNGLAKAYSMLEIDMGGLNYGSQGSRANIVNNVSEAQMQGALSKQGEKQRNVVQSQSDWFTTFEKNKGQVSINITFLAGFLDILEQLNTIITNPTM